MSALKDHSLALLAGLASVSLAGAPAVLADDTELFVNDAAHALPPNILLILDTSGSMDALVQGHEAFDPAATYDGACVPNRVYWREGAGDPPECDTPRWLDASALACAAAIAAFESEAGRLVGRAAQYDASDRRWKAVSPSDSAEIVECADDRGRHGDGSSSTDVYATNGNDAAAWSARAEDEIAWSSFATLTLYSANYLNWYHGPTAPTSRMQVMKAVAAGLAGSINGVNIGLMRYNSSSGGRVVHAVNDVTANRATLLSAIDALSPAGRTPMAETLYEAARYFRGMPPRYGTAGVGIGPDGRYETPVSAACQRNYIVYLTDGEPSGDTGAAALAPMLPGFSSMIGGSCSGSGDGTCLAELARYLYEGDLDPNLPGKQNVATYTIGFTVDLPLLATLAAAGGGQHFVANDTQSLTRALTNIVTSILETQATFTAPTASVNSFNRTQHVNDLFVTVFQPSETRHWPGNLKKYRLRGEDAMIVDANGNPAVDETGFFAESAHSFWSAEPDGRRVTQGGAANRLPSPAARRVFTYLGNPLLVAADNAVRTDNPQITGSLLGLGDPGQPGRDDVIDFIRGRDVHDVNQDGSTSDARRQIGDPLHSQPAALVYGGTPNAPDGSDAVVFVATNDGFLHAIDASTGVEKWAFVAPEFLADQVHLLQNAPSQAKQYGIDGNLRLQVLADHDGIIDASSGEKVYLFFGLRRGGNAYYGLDVTNPDAPSLLWRLDGTDLPGLGQTWSSPVPTRIRVGQTERNAVIFGGGYDAAQDNYAARTDNLGNALYIVDSVTGAVVWHGASSGATQTFRDMRYSIPADVKVIDLDADGLADRMYAADMGGQVWRFDIFNGQPAASLVTGGVIARFGSAGHDAPALADTRRFYYGPDVALARTRAGSFLHIGIGSGYRAHPNETDNRNRFYALRDHDPFRHLTQAEFNARAIITENDLEDVTDDIDVVINPGSAGWMLRLEAGEKVLAEARTFDNDVYFTTFTPSAALGANGCEPQLGTNRLYVVSLFDGAPVSRLDRSLDENELTIDDRARAFHGSIASEVSFLFPSAADPASCEGDNCRPLPVVCVDLFCMPTSFGSHPIRTYWRQESVD